MKKRIALITGGFSGEDVVSYKSAVNVQNALDKEKYEVYRIDITKHGWFHTLSDGQKLFVDKNDFSLTINNAHLTFDAAMLILHGSPGEDGKLMGYFDMLNLPYTGCSAATSAITFNKRYAVAVAKMAGINVAASVHLFKHTPYDIDDIIAKIKFPIFVKPNNGGSSIGMSKVFNAEELKKGIELAFTVDDQVLAEQVVEGREFTIGVYKAYGKITALPITEVKAHDTKVFFDFEAKYEGKSSEITPAVVAESVAEKIREAARKIYEVFDCRGVVRIDFIYNEAEEKPYMLEVNTIPGQTDASLIPQQVAAAGGNLKDFYTGLIEECFS